MPLYEVIVVGLGAVGSAATWHFHKGNRAVMRLRSHDGAGYDPGRHSAKKRSGPTSRPRVWNGYAWVPGCY